MTLIILLCEKLQKTKLLSLQQLLHGEGEGGFQVVYKRPRDLFSTRNTAPIGSSSSQQQQDILLGTTNAKVQGSTIVGAPIISMMEYSMAHPQEKKSLLRLLGIKAVTTTTTTMMRSIMRSIIFPGATIPTPPEEEDYFLLLGYDRQRARRTT